MSHRSSSDAYSRRPTTEDRRPGIVGRRSSYTNKPEVSTHRRDSDKLLRDRRDQAQSPEDSMTASRSPSDSPGLAKNGAHHKLARLLKRWGETHAELTRLTSERHHLEEALKQRQAEYEKTLVKFVDFPSIPELHNTRRTTAAAQARALDAHIQKAQEEANKAIEALGQALLTQPQSSNRESQHKSAVPVGSLQQTENLKKDQDEITKLKAEICKIKGQQFKEQNELEQKLAKQTDEFEKQRKSFDKRFKELQDQTSQTVQAMKAELQAEVQAEVRAEMKKMMEEVAAVRSLREEAKVEMNEQVGLVRAEFEKRQTEHHEKQRDWQSRFSKEQQDFKQEVKQQLSAYSVHNSKAVSSSEVPALIQTETSTLRSNVSSLLGRVDELARLLAQRTDESVVLRTNNADSDPTADQLACLTHTVDEHSAKLAELDIEGLDAAAETLSCDFPNLQKQVATIQTQVDNMPGDIDRKQAELSKQVQTYLQAVGLLQHSVNVLDTQYNNLSTRALAEYIISHIEQVLPVSTRGWWRMWRG
ncbi:hypothetical protein N0V88_000419 [Collariella sp. IMI 366227]|nr:hypothetical protein N0V88_000419 [Collariella sp. IMI 366227]